MSLALNFNCLNDIGQELISSCIGLQSPQVLVLCAPFCYFSDPVQIGEAAEVACSMVDGTSIQSTAVEQITVLMSVKCFFQ